MGAARTQTAKKNITIVHIHCIKQYYEHILAGNNSLRLKFLTNMELLSHKMLTDGPNLFCWRNKLIYILEGLRVSTFLENVHFWVNYPLKTRL